MSVVVDVIVAAGADGVDEDADVVPTVVTGVVVAIVGGV